MHNTWEAYGFTREMLEERLKALEEIGWEWQKWPGYMGDPDNHTIMPPKDDKRNGWCGQWIPIGDKRTVPHWIFHEDALTLYPCGKDSYA